MVCINLTVWDQAVFGSNSAHSTGWLQTWAGPRDPAVQEHGRTPQIGEPGRDFPHSKALFSFLPLGICFLQELKARLMLCPPLLWAESKGFQLWDYCGMKATDLKIERCNSAAGI